MFSYLIVSGVVVQWFAQLPHAEKVVGSIATFSCGVCIFSLCLCQFQVVHMCEYCCGWLSIPIWHRDKPVTCLPSPSDCWDRLQHPVTLSAGGVVTESGLMANQGKCVSNATLTSK